MFGGPRAVSLLPINFLGQLDGRGILGCPKNHGNSLAIRNTNLEQSCTPAKRQSSPVWALAAKSPRARVLKLVTPFLSPVLFILRSFDLSRLYCQGTQGPQRTRMNSTYACNKCTTETLKMLSNY